MVRANSPALRLTEPVPDGARSSRVGVAPHRGAFVQIQSGTGARSFTADSDRYLARRARRFGLTDEKATGSFNEAAVSSSGFIHDDRQVMRVPWFSNDFANLGKGGAAIRRAGRLPAVKKSAGAGKTSSRFLANPMLAKAGLCRSASISAADNRLRCSCKVLIGTIDTNAPIRP